MKIAVLEFVCGGGVAGSESDSQPLEDSPIYRELFREGLLMLRALVSDVSQCGHQVVTCLDENSIAAGACRELDFPNTTIHQSRFPKSWLEDWKETTKGCDATIVIAPELDNHLAQAIAVLRNAGANVLSSSLPFLQSTSDKWICSQLLADNNVPHPPTWLLSDFLKLNTTHSTMPWTLKRRDGAGCVGMRYVSSAAALHGLVEQESNEYQSHPDQWLVQPWLEGQPASMAMVVHSDSVHYLGAMEQYICLEPTRENRLVSSVIYRGGSGPIPSIGSEQLTKTTEAVLHALPAGAQGWIGIDFLLPTPERPEMTVIEINPRLTTSYLGYRKWYGPSLANLILGDRFDSSTVSMPTIAFEA